MRLLLRTFALLAFPWQKLADQALKLKDEVDILRDAADKAAKYEATIESYKKKLEDFGDLRRQVRIKFFRSLCT